MASTYSCGSPDVATPSVFVHVRLPTEKHFRSKPVSKPRTSTANPDPVTGTSGKPRTSSKTLVGEGEAA